MGRNVLPTIWIKQPSVSWLVIASIIFLSVTPSSGFVPLDIFSLAAAHAASVVMTTLLVLVLPPWDATATMNEWHLMNGQVRLPDTIELNLPTAAVLSEIATQQNSHLKLKHPTFIGAGSGGAVFRFNEDDGAASDMLLKVSWSGSTRSVQRECYMLQRLEENGVSASERCLGQFPYYYDQKLGGQDDQGRIMIVLTPYVREAVASVEAIPTLPNDAKEQREAVRQIAATVVQMLAANIATIDVQPLMDPNTGNVIFIDMTEAQELIPPFSFLDKVLMRSFVAEMVALVPERFVDTASKAVMDEVAVLKSRYFTVR